MPRCASHAVELRGHVVLILELDTVDGAGAFTADDQYASSTAGERRRVTVVEPRGGYSRLMTSAQVPSP